MSHKEPFALFFCYSCSGYHLGESAPEGMGGSTYDEDRTEQLCDLTGTAVTEVGEATLRADEE